MNECFPLCEVRSAIFSEDRRYRYTLRVVWEEGKSLVQFVGLNPSTADEVKDDNTVRRCKRFAQRWGYGGMIMTNIFALRSTDPRRLKEEANPVGEGGVFRFGRMRFTNRNDYCLTRVRSEVGQCVVAWGNYGLHMNRCSAVEQLLGALKCLRVTKEGQPEHPLYMPYGVLLRDYGRESCRLPIQSKNHST